MLRTTAPMNRRFIPAAVHVDLSYPKFDDAGAAMHPRANEADTEPREIASSAAPAERVQLHVHVGPDAVGNFEYSFDSVEFTRIGERFRRPSIAGSAPGWD